MFDTGSTKRIQLALSVISDENLVRHIQSLSHLFAEWERRRDCRKELKHLLRVGPHLIADIGLTLEKAHKEIEKPFGRP